MKTAVEWLQEQYYERWGELTRADFEYAKEMEKHQLINSYRDGAAGNYKIKYK